MNAEVSAALLALRFWPSGSQSLQRVGGAFRADDDGALYLSVDPQKVPAPGTARTMPTLYRRSFPIEREGHGNPRYLGELIVFKYLVDISTCPLCLYSKVVHFNRPLTKLLISMRGGVRSCFCMSQ